MPRLTFLSSLVLCLFFSSASAGDYFPIQAGNYWYYAKFDSLGQHIGADTSEMSEHQTVDSIPDIDLYEISRNDDGAAAWGDVFLRDSGQFVYASADEFWFNSPWLYRVHSFYKVTQYPDHYSGTWTPKYVGKVTVPAGTFDSCYEVTSSDKNYGPTITFAPGVGEIKYMAKSKWYSVLTAYHAGSTYTGILARPRGRVGGASAPVNRFRWAGNRAWYGADGRLVRIPLRP